MAKGELIQRTVRSYVGSGRFGKRPGVACTLGPRAMAKQRAEAQSRRTQASQGLSTELQNALGDISGDTPQIPDAMDVDGLGFDFNVGGEPGDDDSDTELGSTQGIVVDLQDYIGINKWHGHRKYKDTRTWKQRINRFHDAWASILDELVVHYINWKYYPSSVPQSSATAGWEFSIPIVDVYSLARETTIHRNSETKATSALVSAGYLAASPESPSLAVSLRTLELFYAIRLFKPNFSVEAFAKTTCHLYAIPYRRSYRTALSDAFDVYLAILRKVDTRVSAELGHNTPDYRALNSCPPCTYELEGEPPLKFSRMVVVDGNNSLKRMDGVGKREVADTRVFGESDYYLSEEFVNTFADEVPARRSQSKTAIEDSEEGFGTPEEHGDPTDGDPDPKIHECADNWKAAVADGAKKMWDAFRESGYFAMACRHGFVLWVADMIRSGELAKYPLAMVAKTLKVFGPAWILGYNIGCSFSSTIRSSSLGSEFKQKGCRTCVNAFHGYSHCAICQQKFHPLNIPGMGLEDLETLERLFSSSNQLASITRYMSPHRRRIFIDLFLQQWDREKYQNLATMLHNNYIQALDILKFELPAFKADLQALNLTEGDIDTYLNDEERHLSTLGSETSEDLHAVAYIELLRNSQHSTSYENASTSFRLHTPSDYQFLSNAASYNVNLSEGRKTETRCRFLLEQRDKVLFEIVQMETAMNVERRWEPHDLEYKKAMEYLNTRKYRQALEHLQKLVVQRLFELHKMSLSNTGYKMRTHIANALQRRSQAIRNAVKSYNTAASALTPPRDTLDWTKVSHFAFLDQFNILQDTQHSVFDQPWAKPVNRSLMKQHRRIQRAREEIVQCNVGIRRLHTSIVDEGKCFDAVLERLTDSPTLGPVSDYIHRRRAVNRLLLARIYQTYDLPGFTGDPSPGKRKGAVDTNLPEPSSHALDPESDDGGDEEDDNLLKV
ncbi:hypothetical protein BT96DRAFT_973001 [Gymnopus androsaceus JB14]|uniref:CxC1-like cysteine cluster associated with KDZ transposases domain-containing protein n=1 Tax=Gymnopus androsaceus JB14 TaxID=1447944 RepID=A0A6A4I5V7_9AGAR|nr:hypothetical protein BT96DRAFT_973001 [Gymnopus androsaceus JB14]